MATKNMKGDGLLKAATEILQATTEKIKKDREVDRRAMTAFLHELEQITTQLSELVPNVADVRRFMDIGDRGRMLKTPQMAERISADPATLRRMAERGDVPGYQVVELGDWRFDPDEVKNAIKAIGIATRETRGIVTREARERAAADPWVRDAPDYDTYRDRLHDAEHRAQIAKEMELGL